MYRSEALLRYEPGAKPGSPVNEEQTRQEFVQHLATLRSEKMFEDVSKAFSPKETEVVVGPYQRPNAINSTEVPVLEILRQCVTIPDPPPGSTEIKIIARHPNPAATALMANRFASKFLHDVLERTATANGKEPATREAYIGDGMHATEFRILGRAAIPTQPEGTR